jgi:ubiquinone biosynthesis protein
MNLTSIPQLARHANRVREIVTILGKYGLADWVSRLDLDFAKWLHRGATGRKLADLTTEVRVRLVLTELGTTFIKLGQMLSTRPDLVGPKVAQELSKLQDDAPADPPAVVRATLETELGKPLAELFAEFEETPLASASIGQVHRARLHADPVAGASGSSAGPLVAVKVQHPGIEGKVRTDLEILVTLAELAEQHLAEARQYQPRATAAEFQRTLLRELNFGREERNLRQFLRHFADDPTVRFPTPYADLSTSRVLTMDYLEGVKLSDTRRLEELGLDLNEVARRGATVFLEMIFRDGFYHADPHPGNLLFLPGGVIGMLDCGMVGRLDDTLREEIEDLLLAIIARDAARLTALITRIGSVPPDLDQAGLSSDLTDFLAYYGHQALDRFDLSGALTEMTEIIRRYHIVLPPGLALLLKVLVMLEGTARLLNPRFSLIELMKPYQHKLLVRRLSPQRHLQKLQRVYHEWEALGAILPQGLRDVLRQLQSGKFTVHQEHKGLEPSVNRLVLGMLTSSLFLGSAMMWSNNVLSVGGVSILGLLGCVVSIGLGFRLLWAIRKSGRLDEQ